MRMLDAFLALEAFDSSSLLAEKRCILIHRQALAAVCAWAQRIRSDHHRRLLNVKSSSNSKAASLFSLLAVLQPC